jgi:hypothetical protein
MAEHIGDLIESISYYFNNTPKKREKEVGGFLTPLKKNYPQKFYNNMSNDLRHAYASAILARDKGQDTAKTLGDLYELINTGTQGDTQRDLKANELGRGYAAMHPDLSNEEMLNNIYREYVINNGYGAFLK